MESDSTSYYKFKKYIFPNAKDLFIKCILVKSYNRSTVTVYFNNEIDRTLWLLKWEIIIAKYPKDTTLFYCPYIPLQLLKATNPDIT
jgi:hypothetical protein